MKRSSQFAAGVFCLLGALCAAEEPAKTNQTVKPPWQRLLQGEDAKKAAEQEKKLAQLQEAGQFTEALKVAEALAELRTKVQGADHWQAAGARFAVVAIRRVLLAKKDVQQSYGRVFALKREADDLNGKRRYRQAQPLFEQVLTIRREVLGEEHPDTALCYSYVADNLEAQSKYREAEEAFRKALAIYRKVMGQDNPDTATSYDNLAAILNVQGKYREAEENFGKALAIRRKVMGEEHPNTATSYNNMAINLNLQGKYREAEGGFGKALVIYRKVLGEEHPRTAQSYNNVAGNLHAHLRQQSPPTSKGLLALADPVFQTTPVVEKSLPPRGVLLTKVLPGSNAFRAGLRDDDVLLRFGDTDLNGPADLRLEPESSDPDKQVPVIFWRDGVARLRPIYVRPGKLGVVVAKAPAPQALAEKQRNDRWLASLARGSDVWNELPGTQIEAAALRHLFGNSMRALQKSEASEQRLNELAVSGELGKYRFVHLATHGEVNNEMPLRSAVILSRDHLPDDNQRTELLLSAQPIPDGRLDAEEALQRWNLQCDLVTLSACQTALGKYERGEGFVGFAQALILCGTRSVCLSLWKVDDTATALLMERFYQNLLGKRDGLKAPMPKAAALAEAKTWLRTLPRAEAVKRVASLTEGVPRRKGAPKLPPLTVPAIQAKAKPDDCPFAHPYYWAAFILTGDPS